MKSQIPGDQRLRGWGTWRTARTHRSETVITADIVEVAGEEPGPAAKKARARQMPKWEADARDRVRAAVRRFARPLADLVARDANEGDTRLLVTDFLCDGLGYDKYEDFTTEYQVKGEFADYGVRIARQLVAFIEVKRGTTKLGAKHLRQVEMYAVNEGVEWMILTNGQVWQVWHLTPGMPVELDLALEVDLLGDGGPAQKPTPCSLVKEGFKRHVIDELWRVKAANLRSRSGLPWPATP